MTPAARIKIELSDWADPQAIDLCVQIVEYMDGQPLENLKMVSFAAVANVFGKSSVDGFVLRALTILTESEVHVLDTRYLLIDDDDAEYPLEVDEVHEAQRTGNLIHPVQGTPVDDYLSKLYPYFAASSRYVLLKEGGDE